MLVHAPGPPKDQKDQPSSHQTPSVPCVWVALGRPGDGQMSQERIVESFPRNWNSQNEYARTWHTRLPFSGGHPEAAVVVQAQRLLKDQKPQSWETAAFPLFLVSFGVHSTDIHAPKAFS